MKKIISITFILLVLAFSFVLLKAENTVFQDLLLGTSPLKLYSYKFGALQVTSGETLYVEIIGQTNAEVRITLIYTENGMIIETRNSLFNEIISLYTFESANFGSYELDVYSMDGSLLAEASIIYKNSQVSIDNFNYYLKTINNAVYLVCNANASNIQYSPTAKYYLALLYNGSYINNTNQLVTGILGGVEGNRIVRYGTAILEQNVSQNSITITPRIINSTNGYINITMDYLYLDIHYYDSFTKYINGTQVTTYTPSYIIKNYYKNFEIMKDSVKINLDNRIFKLVSLNMSGYKEEGNIVFRYTTNFVIDQGKIFLVLGISEMNQTINGSAINLNGEINIDLKKIINDNSKNILKNTYIIVISYDGYYSKLFYKKLDYNLLLFKIFNLAKNKFLTNFSITSENSISYSNNDTSIIFYKNSIDNLYLDITNAIIPLKYIYNGPLEDNSENIITANFYNLNITAVAGDLAKPNITLTIFLNNSTLVYNGTLTFGRINLILPQGNYLIEAKKEGFNSTYANVFLNEDTQLRLELYTNNIIGNDSQTYYIISILGFLLFVHAIINLFIYRRVRKL